MKLHRFVFLPVLASLILLLSSCASVPLTTTAGTNTITTTTALNPFAALAVRVAAADACDQATRQGGASSLLAKVSAADALLSSGDVLSAVESALLSGTGTDPRRAFYLSLVIQTIQTSGNVPKTIALTPGSPAAQLVSSALAGCRSGIGLNAVSSQRVKAESLEAPAPSLASYMYKAGYTDSIAKGSQWFDTSLPLSARIVHGHLDMSFPAGTNERVGLDQSKVKGVMVGFEGGSCDVIQWWIVNVGPSFGVPSSYVCTSADLWDAMYSDGKRGANVWNDVYLSSYVAAHPVVVSPVPDPTNPPAANPICLSGGCFPDLCPANCTTVPSVPPAPPVVPGCPVCAPPIIPPPPPVCIALPARVSDTLRQRKAGHAILNPGRLREVADFFAMHAGSCWVL